MSADVARERVVDAFDAAVSWWHQRLDEPTGDTDAPDTARDYFTDHRGFDAETIEEWRLGWAPADGGLYDYLREQGFDAETVAATGLFCQNAREKELWRGRYIMPYFAADGRAEYAIARCTGSKGGGAAGYDGHPDDFLAGKYAKVAHTRENVPLTEPILGLHTLDGADEVVVAEGIADAITATEAGYAALSPVTKEFKREHFDELVDAVETHGIDRVYVVPDAEIAGFAEIDSDDVPDEPEHIHEAINLPTVAPGPGGGLRTASYLVEQRIDARVVELPRPSAEKVDLDDYLQGWAESLDAALASAKPPAEHPQYDAATATQDTEKDLTTESEHASETATDAVSDNLTPVRSGDGASGLFALDVGDVNPDLEAGYRGKNPLGHTGDSETYFVVNEHPETGDLIAKDYKRSGEPRYTGCTYLLVEMGERPVEGPMGELSPRETWLAWAEARERGLLDAGDVVPEKALEHVAREQNQYDFDALDEPAGELPPKAHNRALWWVNNVWPERDGVDVTLDDDENATARNGRAGDAGPVRTWEDVRYIFEKSKEKGRAAARALLADEHDFMTLAAGDELMLYDDETGVYTAETGPINGEIYDGLGEHWSTHEKNEIVAGLRQQNVVHESELNAEAVDGPHICVENGVLNLFTRELKDHSPEHYFTRRVPVTFDPDADTAPYQDFADELVERDADRKALFEMVGHALMPDANERYKKFLILTGDADNGKSVFFRRVKALLDGPAGEEQNTASVKLSKLAQNQFSNYSLYGTKANIAGEIDGKRIQNTAAIKDITGGDTIEIEPKGKDSFFTPINSTLMFAANDPPIIGKRDKEAIRSRIVPIELPYTFVDEPDGELEKQAKPERELKAELETPEALSGFLNLALDGLERLEENAGDVSLPETPEERLRKYERTADPMREFGERCLTNDPDAYLVKADVTTLYREFANSEGYVTGESVHNVLHSVLRGVPGLNYTDSRPERPDYSDVDLPLRGWDERKTVVDRVTLTDEGLKHAKSAGIVRDTPEEAGTDGSNPTLGTLEPGRYGGKTVEATVAEKMTEPKPYLQAEGALVDDGEILDFEARGDSNPLSVVAEGDRVRITHPKVTEQNGVLTLEVSGVCDVEVLPSVDDEQSSVEQAATDGGDDDTQSREAVPQYTRAVAETVRDAAEPVGVAHIIQHTEGSPDALREAIDTAREQGLIRLDGDDSYVAD